MEMLDSIRTDITAEDYFRAKFVIEEKERVLAVCEALNIGDYETVGKNMYATHKGLSYDYEVSCEELDYLNDIAKECGVTGSRIMGDGFGGCTINLVKKSLRRQFHRNSKKKIQRKVRARTKSLPCCHKRRRPQRRRAMNPKKTVLISGGAGYIGSHTSVELLEAGYNVVIIDNLNNSERDSISGIEEITGKKVDFEVVDTCDKSQLKTVFETYNFYTAIHFAKI